MKESEWIRTHLEEIVKKYAGNYIAVVDQEVVSSNKSGVEAEQEARHKYPDKMPMVFRVPREEDFNCLL